MLPEVSKARCFSFFTYSSRIRTSNFSAFSFNFCSLLDFDCTSLDFAAVHQNAVVFCLIAEKKEKNNIQLAPWHSYAWHI